MPWTDGLETEVIGHIQSRGWHQLDAEAAAREAAKAHRAATVKLGIEPDRVLRIPDKGDEAAWANVYKALGVPDSPDKYVFEGVDEATQATLRQTAAALRLPAEVGPKLLEQFKGWNTAVSGAVKAESDKAAAAAETARVERVTQTKAANTGALQVEWNAAGGYDANYQRAMRAAAQLGYSAEDLTDMAGTDKYVPFMRRMLAIDKAGAESGMPGLGNNGGGNGDLSETEEQLLDRKEKIFETRVRNKMVKPDDMQKIMAEVAEIDRKIVMARANRRP